MKYLISYSARIIRNYSKFPRWSIINRIDHKKINKPKKILIATNTGGHLGALTFETLLSQALIERSAKVDVLLCNKSLPACMEADIRYYKNENEYANYGPKKLCNSCVYSGEKGFKNLDVRIIKTSQLINEDDLFFINKTIDSLNGDINDIKKYVYNSIKLGEHAYAGTARFTGKGRLEDNDTNKKILNRYLKAALVSNILIQNLINENNYDCAVFHHGIYVPQGIVGETMRKNGIRVVNWNAAYRKKCFIFSHDDSYHFTLMDESPDIWEKMVWSSEKEKIIDNYLDSRAFAEEDWIWFHKKPNFDLESFIKENNIDKSKPIIGMLTNVFWDAQLHFPQNAFSDMLTWVIETVKYFKKRPDLQLIIRIHPAEIYGAVPSRQKMYDEIQNYFPEIPSNIIVVPPENNISTYSIMKICNSAIIYGTKMGVELTAKGLSVIVAGEAWIKGKGISIDANDSSEYFNILDRLPMKKKISSKELTKAKKYAYHFFMRKMIPIKSVYQTGGWPPYKINEKVLRKEKTLLNDEGLNVICQGILNGSEFIYDEK